jgi:hypothetical protein
MKTRLLVKLLTAVYTYLQEHNLFYSLTSDPTNSSLLVTYIFLRLAKIQHFSAFALGELAFELPNRIITQYVNIEEPLLVDAGLLPVIATWPTNVMKRKLICYLEYSIIEPAHIVISEL